jgi:hypothetical protein
MHGHRMAIAHGTKPAAQLVTIVDYFAGVYNL